MLSLYPIMREAANNGVFYTLPAIRDGSYGCDDVLDGNVSDDGAEQHGLQPLRCWAAEYGEGQKETAESGRLVGR